VPEPDGMIVYSLDLDLKARIGMLAYWWEGAREVFATISSISAFASAIKNSTPL